MRRSMTPALACALLLALSAPTGAAECKHNSDCADGDACTIDRCIKPGKVCRHIPVQNGQSCNDGSACTVGDTCQSGVCTGAAVACTASDQCHVAGTCDPATGICSDPAAPDGVDCNDRDLCTQTDTCQAGVCVGANSVVCTPIDACHVAGACNSSTGLCSHPPREPLVCTAVDQCNQPGTCDPGSGACTTPPRPDGTGCTDGDACTQTDSCQAAACVGGSPVDCSDVGVCQLEGTCDSFTGECSGVAAPDGTACGSGPTASCSTSAICAAGTCAANGSGDTDADGICDADDGCPTTADAADRDLDGDGLGDVCDDSDAVLAVRQALVRTGGRGRAHIGGIVVRGTFPAAPPDAFGATAGVTVRVTDATGVDVSVEWGASECGTFRHGRIVCRSASDPASQAKFLPLMAHPGIYKYKLRLAHLDTAGPVTAPLTVTVTHDGAVDRVGAAGLCREVPAGQTCKLR
jgi:hypothetical protein